ncbi:MAG: hypothetical protein ABEH83_08455 [Halobacterium sp.]
MTIPFSDETVSAVAADADVSESALREAAVAVQATLADYPGRTVDGLVYEWRQAFRVDPLIERRPDAWVLRVPERVWADVVERSAVDGGVGGAVAGALATLHETGIGGVDSDREDGVVLLVARE